MFGDAASAFRAGDSMPHAVRGNGLLIKRIRGTEITIRNAHAVPLKFSSFVSFVSFSEAVKGLSMDQGPPGPEG